MLQSEIHTARGRVPRWLMIALVIGIAIVIAGYIIARSLPTEAEVQVKIGNWTVPAGVVVQSDDLRSQFPGLVIGSLLGKTDIQINAGRVEEADASALSVKSWVGEKDVTYRLTDNTRWVDARSWLAMPGTSGTVETGDSLVVVTIPDDNEALLIVTGVSEKQ